MFISDKILKLSSLPLFRNLGNSELFAIASICHLRNFEAGELVYRKSAVPQRLSIAISGSLVLVDEKQEGTQICVFPELLGVAALLYALPLSKDCRASKEAGFSCLQIRKSNFFSLVHECPELLVNFMKVADENASEINSDEAGE